MNRSRVQSHEQPSFLSLLDDDAAVLFFPRPDVFEELLAAQVVAVLHHALLAERLFHHRLRGDAGVVGAGQPEHFLAVHPRLAGEDVLDGVVQDVPHVEHARHVGGRDDDRIRRFGRRGVGDEAVVLQPEVVPLLLDRLRFVGFGNFRHGHGFTSA